MRNKAFGAILMPYIRIGGGSIYQGPLFAHVQTDGSWKPRLARVAAIVATADGSATYRHMESLQAENSTETEWASVAYGIRLALKYQQDTVCVENDNLGVIQALIQPGTRLRHDYARYYKDQIQRMSAQTAWTGVRWIPREVNRADALFR